MVRLPAMREMARAVRLEFEKYGSTLGDLPDDVLRDYIEILSAFVADLRDEKRRRAKERGAEMVMCLDAYVTFQPGSLEPQWVDFTEGLVRLAADMDHPALRQFAFYGKPHEVEA